MAQKLWRLDPKKIFFDDKRIRGLLGKAEVKSLRRYGSICRQDARRAIKRPRPVKKVIGGTGSGRDPITGRFTSGVGGKTILVRKVSRPGSPPFSHTKKGDIRQILFSYDRMHHSIVIGAIKFRGKAGATPVPSLLEHGGTTVIRVRETRKGRTRFVRKTVMIRARPNLRPVGLKNAPKFGKFMKQALAKG